MSESETTPLYVVPRYAVRATWRGTTRDNATGDPILSLEIDGMILDMVITPVCARHIVGSLPLFAQTSGDRSP